tara:strand:- start:2905 stop:3885 length:981 start_codon:yes stop_codon:yes gene_type:complete
MSKINLKSYSDQEYKDFLENKKVNNIFFSYNFLKSINTKTKKINILNGLNSIGIAILPEADLNGVAVQNDLHIYAGIYIFDDIIKNLQRVKLNDILKNANIAIADFIVDNYVSLTWQTNFQKQDLRPYSWSNYDRGIDSFTFLPRYTSIKNIESLVNQPEHESESYKSMVYDKRRMIKSAINSNAKVIINNDTNDFLYSYKIMMESYGETCCKNELDQMYLIIENLIKSYNCNIYHVLDVFGNCLYKGVFAFSNAYAYYLYGAKTDFSANNNWHGSFMIWEVSRHLAALNIKFIDLEGINSPNRGWFKESFGGETKLYFSIKYKKL